MANRRGFLAGLMATGLCPRPVWADVGDPAYLAAARKNDGSFVLCGLSTAGGVIFSQALPGRGHAAAAHPIRPEAVAFARRPGRFALVLDCRDGSELARLDCPAGRHFYGHGCFSADGTELYTTENDYENGQGRVGIWDAQQSYTRIGEFSSGGIGPHELAIMPSGGHLVIANGGIDTHPETGRTKLNLDTMTPNLSILRRDGVVVDQITLPAQLHKNSMRHLAMRRDGTIAVALQWQGAVAQSPALLGLYRVGERMRLLSADEALHRKAQGYAGSVAFSMDQQKVAITAPRGDVAYIFNVADGQFLYLLNSKDICGVAPGYSDFLFTNGQGDMIQTEGRKIVKIRRFESQWDNHLIAISES